MFRNHLSASSVLAVIIGVLLPVAESIRRVHDILGFTNLLGWLDDYILGGILIVSGYRVIRKYRNSIYYLIGAWGFTSGALFLSFLGQFSYYTSPSGDPGIFSTTLVAIAKGMFLLVMLFGLKQSIEAAKEM